MAVIFKEDGHIYESLDSDLNKDSIKWTSVTSFISKFKPKFNAKAQAKKSSKNKRSKWYGMTEKDILAAWEGESNRAITLGNWYHGQRETDLLQFETIERHGVEVPIVKPIEDGQGIKIAPEQTLENGVYPEHMVYLKSAGICGQADLVEVIDNKLYITDYKTNKKIESTSYVDWEGKSKRLYKPLSHLDDCNLNHYNLQLSLYAYIIMKHNPKLKIGGLCIQHVKFEIAKIDDNGYPVTKVMNGEPVIDEVKMYDLPYLKDEIRSLMMWLKDNK